MNSTSGNGELEAAVSHLWQELADVAGCVSTWLRGNGSLDDRRGSILHRRITDLNRILPVLGGADNAPYWPRLYRLPCLVSEADPRPTE